MTKRSVIVSEQIISVLLALCKRTTLRLEPNRVKCCELFHPLAESMCRYGVLAFAMLILAGSASAQTSCENSSGNGSDTPYAITNINQLQAITSSPTSNYVLCENIDAAGTDFVPIGGAAGFSGTFDGNNMTISNLTINRPSSLRVGLFGKLSSGGEIRTLNLVNVVVTGRDLVGALVGESLGNIERSTVTGTVAGRHQVGGLVGAFSNANLSDCRSDVVVRPKSRIAGFRAQEYLGGLVGKLSTATVRRCSAGGNLVLGSTRSQARLDLSQRIVGGLIGFATRSSVLNSFANGSINAGAYTAGGLIGRAIASMISESRATGAVSASANAGGLIGVLGRGDTSAGRRSTVLNSFSTGNVDGSANTLRAGGLISELQETWLVRNSYATGGIESQGLRFGSLLGFIFGTGRLENNFATGSPENSFLYNTGGSATLTSTGNYYIGTTVRHSGATAPSGVTTQVALAQLQCPTTPGTVCGNENLLIAPFENWSPYIWNFGTAEQLPRIAGSPEAPTVRITVMVEGDTLGFTLDTPPVAIPVTASVMLVPAPEENGVLRVALTKTSGTVRVCESEPDTGCVFLKIGDRRTDSADISAGTNATRLILSLGKAGEIDAGLTGEFELVVDLRNYINVGSGNRLPLNFQLGNAGRPLSTVRVTVTAEGSTLGFTLDTPTATIPVTASVTLDPPPERGAVLRVALTKTSGTVPVCESETATNCVYLKVGDPGPNTVPVLAGSSVTRLILSLGIAGEIDPGLTGEFSIDFKLLGYINEGSGNKFPLNFQQGGVTMLPMSTVRVTVMVTGSSLGFTTDASPKPLSIAVKVTLDSAPDRYTTLKVTLTEASGSTVTSSTVTVCESDTATNCVYLIIGDKRTDSVPVFGGDKEAILMLSLGIEGEIEPNRTGKFRLDFELQGYFNVVSGNDTLLNFQQGGATTQPAPESASLRVRVLLGGAVR